MKPDGVKLSDGSVSKCKGVYYRNLYGVIFVSWNVLFNEILQIVNIMKYLESKNFC